MFKKFSKEEWEEMSGMEVSMISMCDKEVVCVYEKMSEYGGSSVGCKYVDGSYSVVGLGRDCMCDYKYMFRRVMEY